MVRINARLELERIRVIENGLAVHFFESFFFSFYSFPPAEPSGQENNTIDFL